mmetsp:Transcript_30515/g.29916  ORF Transcript_30515/g.29916 Transcript_30515/m.29916 type:complete len:325 (-) Transcript_30515:1446-2420(-)
MITKTFANGLIVQFMPNGDIIQTNEDQMFDKTSDEKYRIITKNGLLIRHLRNNDREILTPSGVRARFDRKNMMWVVTNNKGRRTATKDGKQWDIESIPCAVETDAVSYARMMIREDDVMTLDFKDGSFYAQFSDGTQIRTSADKSEVRVEKDGFAPVLVKDFNEEPRPPFDNAKGLGARDRALDKVVATTLLPDGTQVETFNTSNEEGSDIVQHSFLRPDFSVVFATSDGQFTFISSNTRSGLNEEGGKVAMGKDFDYLKEQSGVSIDCKLGIYYGVLSAEKDQSHIFTVDSFKNSKYTLHNNNTVTKSFMEGASRLDGLNETS